MAKGERIIVTGGAGFIGSNLLKLLLRGEYSLLTIDNLSSGTRENLPVGVEFVEMDVKDPNIVRYFEGATTVFHLAAKTCISDCSDHPIEAALNNVLGTAHVLDASVKSRVSHLIYADTSAEYEGIEAFPTPTDKISPQSVYAVSKRGGALLCEAVSRLHPSLRISTVRYFNVYGPAQDWRRVIPPVMSAFTLKLLQGEQPIIYGDGSKRRDFIHVDDVNCFHSMLIENKSIQGGVYNLGTGKDYSVLDIYDRIEGEMRTGIQPIFKSDLPSEALRTQADIKTTLETGWSPKVNIQDGLRQFIQYMKTQFQNL